MHSVHQIADVEKEGAGPVEHGRPAPQRYYVPALDGLRSIAFLVVFVHHLPLCQASQAVQVLQKVGWAGVDLFLVLSSFLFFRLLSLEHDRYGTVDVPRFYLRRALRIWPTYYLFCFAMLAATLVAGTSEPTRAAARFIGLLLFTDNFLMWIDGLNPISKTPHLWTLSFEEQVYLLIPPIFLGVRRISTKLLLGVTLGGLLMAAALRCAFVLTASQAHQIIWPTPFLRPESIVLGALLGLGALSKGLDRLGVASALIIALACMAITTGVGEIAGPGWHHVYLYPVVAVSMGLIVAATLRSTLLQRLLAARWLVFCGRVSYGLYLYHLLGIYLARMALARLQIVPRTPADPPDLFAWTAIAGTALAATLLIASASYYCIERPLLRFKERFALVPSRGA